MKPNQINGTVFNEIDDERVLEVSQADETEKDIFTSPTFFEPVTEAKRKTLILSLMHNDQNCSALKNSVFM